MRTIFLDIRGIKRLHIFGRTAALLAVIALCLTGASTKHQYSPHEKAAYADASLVEFVHPGLVITINSAQIASDGNHHGGVYANGPEWASSRRGRRHDPGNDHPGLHSGSVTERSGAVYSLYNTSQFRPAVTSTNQPGPDSGRVVTATGPGQYQYVFHTKAPAGFDATATHTIGIYATRVLTDYNLANNFASAEFNFVPNGAKVTKIHDIIKTASCNSCHDQLSYHGGRRRGIEMWVLCHTQQNVDTTTGGSLDLKVIVHQIHMGANCPA